jgi:TPR repeat protein
LAGQLRAEARGTMVAETPSTTVPVSGSATTTVAQAAAGAGNALSTANASAAPQPAAPESAMAAFYAARGDAMLAHRDISAARKFYEYAATAGSARAAAALARTYDPAFAAQLGEVGLQPDPGLAAVWYRKAAELGGSPAQLSQSGDAGK